MEHSEMTEKQSLALITSMIQEAKGNIGDNSIFYLLWGWLTILAGVTQFICFQVGFEHYYIGWIILMPLGGIASAILGARQNKKGGTGPLANSMRYLWGATTFSILLFVANGFAMGWTSAYMALMTVIGLATFVSGSILKFTPLKIGAWFAWAMAGVSLYVPFEYTSLLIAATMVVSYLIPGYLLKRANA